MKYRILFILTISISMVAKSQAPSPGSIGVVSSTVNYNDAVQLYNIVFPNGSTCNGNYTFRWQQSKDGVVFTPIAGASTINYLTAGVTDPILYFRRITACGTDSAISNVVSVTVNPRVWPGQITPSAISITSGTSPGKLYVGPAAGGVCGGAFSYQWQSGGDGVNFSDIVGASGQSYTPGNISVITFYRVRVTCGTANVFSDACRIYPTTGTLSLNKMVQREIVKSNVTDRASAALLTGVTDVKETTEYMDGMGRLSQTVARQSSPLGKDLVTPAVYDAVGRQSTEYNTFASSSSDGSFKINFLKELSDFFAGQFPGESAYYKRVEYENSMLDRVIGKYEPGNNWVGAGRGGTSQYLFNSSTDSVKLWQVANNAGGLPTDGGYYLPNRLYLKLNRDENGAFQQEYKDKDGHVILKRVQLVNSPAPGHTGWLSTYYVYDDLGNLRFVIQPRGVERLILNNWSFSNGEGASIANEYCFRYEYDARGRMIIKKVPGAGEVRIVYDTRDRLVMSQDSLQRGMQKWFVTCYDALNREDTLALMTDPVHYNDRIWHQNTANTWGNNFYPNVSGYVSEILVQKFYDNYDWLPGFAPTLSTTLNTTNNSNPTYFFTTFNASPNYAVPITAYSSARGLLTGTRSRVMGGSQFLYNIPFYDDHGRIIQTESTNYTNGVDLTTTQYDFTGKPLRTLLVHQKNGNLPAGHIVLTKYAYDPSGRMISLRKITDGTGDKRIDTITYNEMGRLAAKYLGNNVDSLIYDYNIRGWVTGINRRYLTGAASNYFGMELGYDNPNSFTGLTTFLNLQYNGNIAGIIWKGAGDNVCRKYDMAYDNTSRLTGANYTQSTGGAFAKSALLDFSIRVDNYDANGNIMKMNQNGYKIGSSGAIDSLVYNYGNSNKLLGVTDLANDPQSKLGDFHYDPATKGATDYTYDGNGNLVSDKNKAIRFIQYNYLNQPELVSFMKADGSPKGNVAFKYDAQGTKLVKVITDSTVTPVKTTTILYAAGFQYENDSARFWGHEEGRSRYFMKHYVNGDSSYKILNDYFEKDNLGNVRAILTEDRDTAKYIATMEGAYRSKERALFYNIDETAYPRSSIPGYPVDLTVTNPNDTVSRVDGTLRTMGPGILLKVMRGDSLLIGVKGYYRSTGSTAGGTTDAFSAILSSLASGLAGVTGSAHGGAAALSSSGNPVYGALSTFRTANNTTPSTTPKAYLNWMLLDNQFQYVSSNGQSGALSFTTADVLDAKAKGLGLKNSGYLYIWVSNETKGWDVFFDNLSITHFVGPLVEENHYYPFGLTIAGISDKPLKNNYSENKYRFNGKELQSKEFGDGSGLDWDDFGARMYDPQIGRWHTQDKFSEVYVSLAPYGYAANNPVKNVDEGGHLLRDQDGNIIATPTGQQYARINSTQKIDGVTYRTTSTYNEVVVYTDQGTPVRALQMVSQYVEQENTDAKGNVTYSKVANPPVDCSQNCHGTTFADGKLVITDGSANNDILTTITNEDGYSPQPDVSKASIFIQQKGGNVAHSGKINPDGSVTSDHDMAKPQQTTVTKEKALLDKDVKMTTASRSHGDKKVSTTAGDTKSHKGFRMMTQKQATDLRQRNNLHTTNQAKGTYNGTIYTKMPG